MKLPAQKYRRAESRLDAILFVVTLLWLITSALVVLLYHPGAAHAVQPRPPAQEQMAQMARFHILLGPFSHPVSNAPVAWR
jgi:hypothetical protein